jgi:hypothetical protein
MGTIKQDSKKAPVSELGKFTPQINSSSVSASHIPTLEITFHNEPKKEILPKVVIKDHQLISRARHLKKM